MDGDWLREYEKQMRDWRNLEYQKKLDERLERITWVLDRGYAGYAGERRKRHNEWEPVHRAMRKRHNELVAGSFRFVHIVVTDTMLGC